MTKSKSVMVTDPSFGTLEFRMDRHGAHYYAVATDSKLGRVLLAVGVCGEDEIGHPDEVCQVEQIPEDFADDIIALFPEEDPEIVRRHVVKGWFELGNR
jgi:hypothetical protein